MAVDTDLVVEVSALIWIISSNLLTKLTLNNSQLNSVATTPCPQVLHHLPRGSSVVGGIAWEHVSTLSSIIFRFNSLNPPQLHLLSPFLSAALSLQAILWSPVVSRRNSPSEFCTSGFTMRGWQPYVPSRMSEDDALESQSRLVDIGTFSFDNSSACVSLYVKNCKSLNRFARVCEGNGWEPASNYRSL